MNVGAIIICRYNSSRLPGKIFKKINKKTILENIIKRLEQTSQINTIVVATSEEKTDDIIADYCNDNKINLHRGSLNNVALRFKECASVYNLDYALRVNGDNVFIDIDTMNKMIEIAVGQKLDFVSNVPGRSFPYGMSIEIVKTSYYNEVYDCFDEEGHYEHVTKYIYDIGKPDSSYYHKNIDYPELKSMQLAIDTSEDYERAKLIVKQLPYFPETYSMYDINKAINNII